MLMEKYCEGVSTDLQNLPMKIFHFCNCLETKVFEYSLSNAFFFDLKL